MAFDIVLQTNNSEKNTVMKDIDDVITLTGILKEATSITNPSFIIEADLDDLAAVNYLTVETFGRSYFVTDIRSVRSSFVEITCHVDVLSSFADEIKVNKAIVRTQENQWNLYLNDGTFKVYQNPMILTKAFPSGFTTQEFVLAVAGG